MKKAAGKYIFSPSDLLTFMESEFASWMDRLALDYPGRIAADSEDEELRMLQSKGREHERSVLASLHSAGQDVCEISGDDPWTATLEAMQEGHSIIYNAALRHERFIGFADFLARVPGKSLLGDYHYEVWDAKLALKPKPYFLVQLCCYAEMLEELQGRRPRETQVVLGSGERRRFRTDDYFFYYRRLKKAFLELQAAFDPARKPIPSGADLDHGRWKTHAEEVLEQLDHLSRVANIRTAQIRRLEQSGIKTMRALAATSVPHVRNMAPSTFENLRRQARLQVESAGLPRPHYELLDPDPLNPRRGLALLPPPSPMDVCFDIEGYPFVEGGLEYLFGVTYSPGKNLEFKSWWAHDWREEKAAFESFVDWIVARRKKDPAMHIYHYAAYEVSAMKRLMGRYGTREDEVDDLLRGEAFVDLYTVVRQSLRVGEPGYSLKNLEHLYMNARSASVATAADSLVFYQRWLESGEDPRSREPQILTAIRDYNREDCASTWKLVQWLRALQHQAGVSWIPRPAKNDKPEEKLSSRGGPAALGERLLSELPEDRSGDPERWRIQELLAWLLEFHRREEKPVWWSMFDRHAMTEQQLIDDLEALGALERTDSPVRYEGNSDIIEYHFDPDQDTKIAAGDRCRFAHDLSIATTIEELDPEKGTVSIRLGPSAPAAPERLNLILVNHYRADAIQKSIYRTAQRWAKTRELPPALADFLYRRRPRISGNATGPIVLSPKRRLEESIQAVANLNDSTICIQGPPGSGKTYTAAHCILELLKRGKKVGVTSNSHKAICKLMSTVAQEAAEKGQSLRGVKVGKEDAHDPFSADSGIVVIEDKKDVFRAPHAKLPFVGGTAWLFSEEMAAGKFDFLFVDEAGQVSIANLVGMAPCARNLVLVGDQMQLGQPVKGSHPGESGQSSLEYLLQGHATIPDNFGIFLGTSYRMHPAICSFISGAVYEDRLTAEPDTVKRKLDLPRGGGKWIGRDSGILFIPVEHEGNSQGSEEEADVICEIIGELTKCKWFAGKSVRARPLTMQDILIVAPYNMQVRILKRRLPAARIGTVDKFQGQEAPVVLISMASSTCDASPRGMEFLFSKNRLNVAISRAQSLAIVVAAPALARARCSSIEQMELVNLFCRIVDSGS